MGIYFDDIHESKESQLANAPVITQDTAEIKAIRQLPETEENLVKLENALKNIDDTQNFIDNGDSTIAAEKEKLKKKVSEAEKQLKSTKEVYDHNKAIYDRDVENARDQDNQYAGSALIERKPCVNLTSIC